MAEVAGKTSEAGGSSPPVADDEMNTAEPSIAFQAAGPTRSAAQSAPAVTSPTASTSCHARGHAESGDDCYGRRGYHTVTESRDSMTPERPEGSVRNVVG